MLAMLRGESEGILNLSIAPPSDDAISRLQQRFIQTRTSAASEQVKLAILDSYKRLLAPAMETELRNQLKAKADTEAIKVFSNNARELLLSSPLGHKRVLAV